MLTRLQKKDGSYTWVECTSSRGKDCIIVISRDVSSRTKTVIKDSVITRDYDSSSMAMGGQQDSGGYAASREQSNQSGSRSDDWA